MAAYDKETYAGKEAPKTIADFFDVKKFPGKRGMHTWANAVIEMALVADGVDPKDVYKVMDTQEGIDRAFKKIDAIKDHVVFWSSGTSSRSLSVMASQASPIPSPSASAWSGFVVEGQLSVPLRT